MYKPFSFETLSSLAFESLGYYADVFSIQAVFGDANIVLNRIDIVSAKPSGPVFATINGTSLGETLTGTEDDDIIDTRGGNDVAYGLGGNDSLFGEDGNDTLDGGEGNDQLDGGDDNDSLYGRGGVDTFIGGNGDDSLYIDVFDVLDGGSISGGAGYDTVYVDFLSGVSGNDRRIVFDMGAAQVERYVGSNTAETVDATNSATGVVIYGNRGSADSDGNVGDVLIGSAFNDTIYFEYDVASIQGGAGIDTAVYNPIAGTIRGVTLDLGQAGIEIAVGRSGNDYFDARTQSAEVTLYGDAGADTLLGGTGRSTMYGGDGNDDIRAGTGTEQFLYGEGGDDLLIGNPGSAGTFTVDGGADTDMLVLTGDSLLDYNIVYQSSGQIDIINLRGNGQTYLVNNVETLRINGQNYAINGSQITGLLREGDGTDNAIDGSFANDTINTFGGADTIRTYGGSDIVDAGDGNDIIYGTSGEFHFDTITGGAGNDSVFGGTGTNDIFVLSGAGVSNYTFVTSGGTTTVTDTVGGDGVDSIQGIEIIRVGGTDYALTSLAITEITGTTGNDILYGTSGDDVIRGLGGNDRLYSLEGNDTVYVGVGDTIVNAGTGTNTIYATSGRVQVDYGNSTDGKNTTVNVEVSSGTNLLVRAIGTLNITNGSASDYTFQQIGDSEFMLISQAGSSARRVEVQNLDRLEIGGNVWLSDDGSAKQLKAQFTTFGTTAGETIIGTGLGDRIDGGEGGDAIYGGTGSDIIYGGVGNDLIYSSNFLSPFSWQDSLSSAFSDTVFGGDGNDTIYGGLAADSFDGGAGDDLIHVMTGDTYVGGTGYDTVVLIESGSPILNIDMGATSIERAFGGARTDTFDASTQTVGVTIYSGGSGDTLIGSAHTDYFFIDEADIESGSVDGNGGYDWMLNNSSLAESGAFIVNMAALEIEGYYGTSDADVAEIVSAAGVTTSVTIFGNGGAGYDYIIYNSFDGSGLTFDLGANGFEGAVGRGGNDVFDASTVTVSTSLYGAGGNDTLIGGSSTDYLYGDTGNDTYTGNGGFDYFLHDNTFGADTITDFTQGDDVMIIRTAGVASMANIVITQDGADALLTMGANSIRLTGVTAANLMASDFIFAPTSAEVLDDGPTEAASADAKSELIDPIMDELAPLETEGLLFDADMAAMLRDAITVELPDGVMLGQEGEAWVMDIYGTSLL